MELRIHKFNGISCTTAELASFEQAKAMEAIAAALHEIAFAIKMQIPAK